MIANHQTQISMVGPIRVKVNGVDVRLVDIMSIEVNDKLEVVSVNYNVKVSRKENLHE